MTDWASSLLPDRLPDVPGAELVATYLPGRGGAEIRGDWYAVEAHPAGAVLIAIGDVVGSGPTATALVERLRRAVRMYARHGLSPAAILQRLNALTADVRHEMSTVLVISYDPRTGAMRAANAGHPPALVRRAAGEVVRWDALRGLPLGVVRDGGYADDELGLTFGDVLFVYTDGLIERRGIPVSEALDLLQGSVALASTADDIRSAVLDAMLGGEDHDDDVAVLALGVRDQRASPLPG